MPACGRLEFATFDDGGSTSDSRSPTCVGHDEDGDGFPDECDNCPGIANPEQEDRGERDAGAASDGVGDACDPRPALAGDRIALFVPYTEDPLESAAPVGIVSWDGADMVQLGAAGAVGLIGFDAVARFTRAELRYRVTSVGQGVVYGGLWTRITMNLNDSVFPQLADEAGTGAATGFYIKESIPNMPDRASPFVRMSREVVAGDEIRTLYDTELATGGPQRYTIEVLTTSELLTTELVDVTRPFTGRYSYEMVNIGFAIAYLALYDAP